MNATTLSAADVWTVAADRLKQKNELLYRQWFQNMTPLRLEEDTLTLGVSDDFFASIITDEYDDLMTEALQGIAQGDFHYQLEPGHVPAPAPAPAVRDSRVWLSVTPTSAGSQTRTVQVPTLPLLA